MGSLNFNQNIWYQIHVTRQTGQSMYGTPLYQDNGSTGAAFFQIENSSSPGQKWQFWAYNTTTYLLRCANSGPHAYLGVGAAAGASSQVDTDATTGNSWPIMAKYTVADASMFWQVEPWGDGTYYLYNLANGSDWRLNVEPTSLMNVESNITAPQVGQQFTFEELKAIDDEDYSTYNLYPTSTTTTAASSPPSTTAAITTTTKAGASSAAAQAESRLLPTSQPSTAQPSAGTPSAAASSATPSAAPSSSISAAAAAGIGVAVAVVAIGILSLLGRWFFRRRHRRHISELAAGGDIMSNSNRGGNNKWGPWGYRYQSASEMPVSPGRRAVVMASWGEPVELAGDSAAREGPQFWSVSERERMDHGVFVREVGGRG